MKNLLKIIILLLFLGVIYLLFWPVKIQPIAWQAPTAPPLTGQYAPNQALASATRFGEGFGPAGGPEDVAVDAQGRIYGGYEDGTILQLSADGNNKTVFANTGGRPLGLDFAPNGDLIVADVFKGLLAITPAGKTTTLATAADGIPFKFTDDVDVATDGKIYFSDASSRWGRWEVKEDILEHVGYGRLLLHDRTTGKTTTLLSGLQFANGVAVSANNDFVLVNETGSYKITRYWLQGDKAGQNDVFMDNLPGMPDGISSNGKDRFWVAIYTPRNAALDMAADKPWLRKVMYRLPEFIQPKETHYGFVLGLDNQGQVVANLQDDSATAYAPITSVEQVGNTLFLGSLYYNGFATYPAP